MARWIATLWHRGAPGRPEGDRPRAAARLEWLLHGGLLN